MSAVALLFSVAALVIAIIAISLVPTEPERPVAPPPPPPPPQKDVAYRPAVNQDVSILINRIVELETSLRTEKAENFLLKARLSEATNDS